MKSKAFGLVAMGLLCGATGPASAGVITSLYGDVDGSAQATGYAGTITDIWLSGSRSWTQTFSFSGTISSANIEIAHAALGFYPPAGVPRLFLDGTLVGPLTDMDACDGSAAPGVSSCGSGNYRVDVLAVAGLSALVDGIANFTIETGSGDGWLLDYSRLTINTVPEPGTLALFGVGLLGLSLTRRKAL